MAAEYLTARFGSPIVFPANASIVISIKIAACSPEVFDLIPGHDDKNKLPVDLLLPDKIFKRRVCKVMSAQKEIIGQQLHQYAIEQIAFEIASYDAIHRCGIDESINVMAFRRDLSTDIETLRKIYQRQRAAAKIK
jgi:hypothetical protein